MKIRFIVAMIGLLVLNKVSAQEGIKFYQGSFEELKKEALAKNKPFFIDCYTTWCGPCKRMASEVFPKPEVTDFYNTNFIAYQVDMEKGEGPKLAKDYIVQYYPTFLFFNAKGELVHKSVGGMPPKTFIEEGKKGLDPEKGIYAKIKKFENGSADAILLKELSEETFYIDPAIQKKILTAYWKTQPIDSLSNATNWNLFSKYEESVLSPPFLSLEKNKFKYQALYTEDAVTSAIMGKAIKSLQNAAELKDKALFEKAKSILDTFKVMEVQQYAGYAEMIYYAKTGDWKKFNSIADPFVANYVGDDWEGLNQISWEVLNSNPDKEALAKVEKWSAKSVGLMKAFNNTDTYAHVLYAQGNKAEAKKWATEAIKLGKENEQDVSATEAFLKKINEK